MYGLLVIISGSREENKCDNKDINYMKRSRKVQIENNRQQAVGEWENMQKGNRKEGF